MRIIFQASSEVHDSKPAIAGSAVDKAATDLSDKMQSMDEEKEELETSHTALGVHKLQGDFSPRKKKHKRSSETKLTCSGSEARGNLQPKTRVIELCPCIDRIVATLASGFEMPNVEVVHVEKVWLQNCRKELFLTSSGMFHKHGVASPF